MSYTTLRPVSKRKRKLNKKVVIPLLILLMLIAYVLISFYLKSKEPPVIEKTLCNYSHIESRELFKDKSFTNTLELNDYFVYGETLNLFNKEYELQTPDMFIGKTLVLINLCDQSERVYMIEDNVDGQIPMEDLPVGFYEVYIMHNLERHRVFTNGFLEDTFTTINRQENTKKIRLVGDAYLLENTRNDKQTFDRNYLFIDVSKTTLDENVYDVVLDPAGYDFDSGWLDLGVKANNLVEAEENYKMAQALKKEFEKYGLNVLITRDADETVNTYDIDGRLYRGYQSQAKYYLQIQMVGANSPDTVGTQIIYSSYTSPRLASSVLKQLIENTRLQTTGISGSGNIPGVLPSSRANGYDGRMVIRESGGKALKAASYSKKSEENSSFALNNRRGMQTLILEYIYLTHQPSAQYWQQEYEEYAKETVQGFVNYFNLELMETDNAN